MDKPTQIRIILFALAWINTILVKKGLQPLPVLSEAVVSDLITFVVSVWALHKNNYWSKTGKRQKAVLKANNLYKR